MMKLKIYLSFALPFITFSFTAGQGTRVSWAGQLAGQREATVADLTIDSNGNIYSLGTFTGTVDMDPGNGVYNLINPVVNQLDIFVSVMDSAKNLIWAQPISGTGNIYANQLMIDNDCNIYISGTFSGWADFDPDTGTAILSAPSGHGDGYLCKFNQSGDLLWAKDFAMTEGASVSSLVHDGNGSVYFHVHFSGNIDADPGPAVTVFTAANTMDVAFLKIDSSANLKWARHLTTTGRLIINDIVMDNQNYLYTGGSFSGTFDCDPGNGVYNLISPTNQNSFYCKFDTAGIFHWAKTFGNSNNDALGYFKYMPPDQIVCTGNFSGTIDIDPDTGTFTLTATSDDNYLYAFDTSGYFKWGKQLLSPNTDCSISDMGLDSLHNIYTIGHLNGPSDLDPGPGQFICVPNGDEDIFFAKHDSAGNLLWAKSYGGTDSDYGMRLAIQPNQNILLTGIFRDTVDFDPGSGVYIFGAQSWDGFYLDMSLCGPVTYSTLIDTVCDLYVSPSGNTYTSTGTYREIFPNSLGCDSIITIELTVKKSTSRFISLAACDIYTSPSGSYTWDSSGVYRDTIPNTVGCDSIIIISLSIGHDTSAVLFDTTCTPYMSPDSSEIWTTSGIYYDTIPSFAGCDSAIMIHLLIPELDTTLQYFEPDLISNAMGVTYQWIYCDSDSIAGANQHTYTVLEDGSYAVIISQNGCIDTSVCYAVVGLRVSDFMARNGLTLSPNPSAGYFKIIWNNEPEASETFTVTIENAVGQKLMTLENCTPDSQIDIFNQPRGLYFVTITGKSGTARSRIMRM